MSRSVGYTATAEPARPTTGSRLQRELRFGFGTTASMHGEKFQCAARSNIASRLGGEVSSAEEVTQLRRGRYGFQSGDGSLGSGRAGDDGGNVFSNSSVAGVGFDADGMLSAVGCWFVWETAALVPSGVLT